MSDYPRCETCDYWDAPKGGEGKGTCEKWDFQHGGVLLDDKRWGTIPETAHILTRYDFGCIHHSDLEGHA